MKNNVKQSIKAITEGAIFAAIYGILALISRYLIMGTDSLMYYFTPLPISVYVVRNKTSYSIAVLLASILLSFLFANPILTMMVIGPNIILGFIFGLLEKYSKIKVLNYLTVFLCCLSASFLSIYAYELITSVGYFDDLIPFASSILKVFGIEDTNFLKIIIEVTSYATIIIDAVIKTVLIYLIFVILVKRLKLINDYTIKIKIPLKYNSWIAVIYILFILIFYFSFVMLNLYNLIILKFLVILTISIVFLYSTYLIYQFVIFLRFKFKSIKNTLFIFIIIICFVIFPISIIMALFLNFAYYNILNDFL